MEITNNCSFPVIAFAWDREYGYGKDVEIRPGETRKLSGPVRAIIGGRVLLIHIPGEICCQEKPDNKKGFQVLEGSQFNLEDKDSGIGFCVRHFSEERVIGEK